MKRKKKRRNSVILVLLLLAVAGTFAVRLVQLQIGIREQEQKLNNLQAAYVQQQQDNDVLRKKLHNADEAQYIERIARDSLGLIKPGEKVYVDASPGD
uniref:FtsB family cell division protein n=1 Tax=Candidatus Fimivicinus sp. TaxID=3056640 RepID=UPI003FEFCFDF